MSKVQSSDNSLMDIANATLSNQLESRLKELERNIAVARQFIGMADECYSKVKHEFELLQQDIGVKNATISVTRHIPALEESIDEKEISGTTRKNKKSRSEPKRGKSEDSLDIALPQEDHVETAKTKLSRRQSEASLEDFKLGKKSKSSSRKTQ